MDRLTRNPDLQVGCQHCIYRACPVAWSTDTIGSGYLSVTGSYHRHCSRERVNSETPMVTRLVVV